MCALAHRPRMRGDWGDLVRGGRGRRGAGGQTGSARRGYADAFANRTGARWNCGA